MEYQTNKKKFYSVLCFTYALLYIKTFTNKYQLQSKLWKISKFVLLYQFLRITKTEKPNYKCIIHCPQVRFARIEKNAMNTILSVQ